MMQPWSDIKEDGFSMTIQRHPYSTNIDSYCDNTQALDKTHPNLFNYTEIDRQLERYKNHTKICRDESNMYYQTNRILQTRHEWCGFSRHDYRLGCYWLYFPLFNNDYTSVLVHWTTNYMFYDDFCRTKYPSKSEQEIQQCTTAMTLHKDQWGFDILPHANLTREWNET